MFAHLQIFLACVSLSAGGSVLRRSDDCFERTDACLYNFRIFSVITRDSYLPILVHAGQLNLHCQSDAEYATCIRENSDCVHNSHVEMRSRKMAQHVCNNESGYLSGARCWASSSMYDVLRTCARSSSMCGIPDCLEEAVANIAECSDSEAMLLANTSRYMTDDYCKHGSKK